MTFIKKNIPLFIICVFHLVGIVGFIINPTYFRMLTPVNLLLSVGLVFLMSNQTKWQFYVSLCFVAICGFFVEVLGVKTGIIFGHYYYGQALGYKLFSVPLLIGLNWAVLIYSTTQFCQFKNNTLNAFFGAALMILLDFFIEQNAPKFDFWYWKGSQIPLQNYIAWFVVSLLLNFATQKHLSQKPNVTAKGFYVVQLLFFATLYFFV